MYLYLYIYRYRERRTLGVVGCRRARVSISASSTGGRRDRGVRRTCVGEGEGQEGGLGREKGGREKKEGINHGRHGDRKQGRQPKVKSFTSDSK